LRSCIFLSLLIVVSCQNTEKPIITADAGVIIVSSQFWLNKEFDIILPKDVNCQFRIGKPCCTKGEILSQKGRNVRVKMSCRLDEGDGRKQWVSELIDESQKALMTFVIRAHAISPVSFIDDTMSSGVKVYDKPVIWKTKMEIHSIEPFGDLKPPVVASENPKVEIGQMELTQNGNMYTASYPVSFTFFPESLGLHEGLIEIHVPETSFKKLTRFAWYEMKKGK
jgi:hypothetical protein